MRVDTIPLVWDDVVVSNIQSTAKFVKFDKIELCYFITQSNISDEKYRCYLNGFFIDFAETLQAAKEKCQEHYRVWVCTQIDGGKLADNLARKFAAVFQYAIVNNHEMNMEINSLVAIHVDKESSRDQHQRFVYGKYLAQFIKDLFNEPV